MTKNTHNRLYWSCRRGMLELDLMLIPFLKDQYDLLSELEKKHFTLLLESTDMELFAWLTGKDLPADEYLAALVVKIRDYAHDPHRNRKV